MRVLLVEDDPKLGPTMAKLLKKQGYSVDLQKDGLVGEKKATQATYDLIILDLNLPGKDGIEIAKGVREKEISTPILMVTSRSELMDKIHGLDQGADDYLTKPFNTGELFARVRALLRRPKKVLPTKLEYEDVTLDPATHTVIRDGQEVLLMPKEFALLEYLMRNKENAVSRDELLRHVWGVYSLRSSNRLEVYIRYLRNKLDKPFKEPYIKTVRGIGYKLAR